MPRNRETEPLLQRPEPTYTVTAPDDTTVPVEKGSRGSLTWILIGIWSAAFLVALDTTIVATLISSIGSHFRQSYKASYLGTSYLLSSCCFTPLYGRLSDILGRRGGMMLALTLFASGTLFCGLAQSMNALIAARAIAGMGGGGIMTVSSIALTDLVPLKERGLYQGLANIFFGLGSGLGGPLGGWINDIVGWRWAFLMQIPFLLISMVIASVHMNIQLPYEIEVLTAYEKMRRIDWLGSFTLVATVGCLLLGISLKTSEDVSWSSPLVLGLLVASAVSAILFVIVEVWSVAPVMPLRILARRTPMATALANMLVSITYYTMLYNVPLYFSAVRLTSSSQAGSHLIPNAVAVAFGSVSSGWLMHRTGKLYYLTAASALLTILSSVLTALWNEKTSAFHLWFDIVPSSLGASSLVTTLLVAMIASVPKEDTAIATGAFYLFRMAGQVLGVALSGALAQAVLLRHLREKITGPNAEYLIQRIRHETAFIATLRPALQKAAVDSYAAALRAVFVCQAWVAVCNFLACLPIEENPLPGSHEERRRRETQDLS